MALEERRGYKTVQIQTHVLGGQTPALISSLGGVLHCSERSLHLIFCPNIVSPNKTDKTSLIFLESSRKIGARGELCGLNPKDRDGGYTVQLSSVVYNVICTFNLHLGWTLLKVINLQCHVIRRPQ